MTYAGQVDTSIPIKEQVVLRVVKPLYLVTVNGNHVSVHPAGQALGLPFGYTTTLLPVGEHTLEFRYGMYIGSDSGSLSASGRVSAVYNFEAGYTYTITPRPNIESTRTETRGGERVTTSSGALDLMFSVKEKEQQAVHVGIETGPIFMGLGKGPINVIGFDMGIQPIGIMFDTGKVSFGMHTNLKVNFGWAPNPLKKDFEELNIRENVIQLGGEFSPSLLFSMNFNRDKCEYFGIGIGIGFTTDPFEMLFSERKSITISDWTIWDNPINYIIDVPAGAWFIRGAIIPARDVLIYFDYYLLNLLKEINPNPLDLQRAGRNIDVRHWDEFARHPANWSRWGLGFIAFF
jgi:hypothetical protein